MTHHPLAPIVALLACCTATPAAAAELRTTRAGIEIVAGSIGTFTLTYPEFEPKHGAIEVQADGAGALVRYEGGARCAARIDGNEIAFSLENLPADVKSWKCSMLIDIGFANGGAWKIGEREGEFPARRSAPPQFASLHGTSFTLRDPLGQRLTILTPEHSFQQLTDNREWDWAIYNWLCLVPRDATPATARFVVSMELGPTAKLIDAFGQSIRKEFPNKLRRAEDLAADLEADRAYYASLAPPSLDRFGGAPGTGRSLGLKSTGFFHVERKGDRWWLVDPDGNAFFHIGVCGFAPSDDYTHIRGREGIYEWLPDPRGEFASAFRPGDDGANLSFYLTNTIRKFRQPYDPDSHAARMIDRLRRWGFNSIGAFSPTPPTAHAKASFPYVAHLPINEWEGVPRIPGAHEVWDPYDPATARAIEERIARELPGRAPDPLLIGWFIVNEPRYDELPRVIPSLDGGHACKRRLISMLKERYATIAAFNAAWQGRARSFDELLDAGLAVTTDIARADVRALVDEFLETALSQIERLCRHHDPNHLLLGCRLQPVTIDDEALCRIMGRHLDVISYNYYTYAIDAAALRRFHAWSGARPMMLSEFFWASPADSGLVGGREVESQRERGLAYRNYVEQSAALGFVVGVEWFTLVDQATTGRWFSRYNGESYNTGLLSVADRPWKEMLDEMMKTNHTIYDLLAGKRPPFAWDDPRFRNR